MKKIVFILATVLLGCLLSGCSIVDTSGEKENQLEYTIVGEKELPEELLTMINEKKTAEFKMTYADKENLYIVRGYGEQPTGGYSIQVNGVTLSDNGIHVDTNLIGPETEEEKGTEPSYPFIVLKTAYMDKTVMYN